MEVAPPVKRALPSNNTWLSWITQTTERAPAVLHSDLRVSRMTLCMNSLLIRATNCLVSFTSAVDLKCLLGCTSVFFSTYMHEAFGLQIPVDHLWPWTTKPVIRVKFLKLRFIHHLESWINKLSIDVWFGWDRTIFKIQPFKNLESEGAKKSKYCENRKLKLSKLSS